MSNSNSNICKHLASDENERVWDNCITNWYCNFLDNYINPSECINCNNKSKKQKEIVYLANPYGFSKQQNEKLLPEIVSKIESLGYIVWEPFKRNNQTDFTSNKWAYEVGQKDKSDVENCDIIFAIVNGIPDEGVMIELGIAIALGKKIYLFRDDFRKCTDSGEYPLNLMLFCGLPKDNWKDFYFESVDEIEF